MGNLRDVIEHVLKKRPRRGKEKIVVVLRKVKRKSFALKIHCIASLSILNEFFGLINTNSISISLNSKILQTEEN